MIIFSSLLGVHAENTWETIQNSAQLLTLTGIMNLLGFSIFYIMTEYSGRKMLLKETLERTKAEASESLQHCCTQEPWAWFPVLHSSSILDVLSNISKQYLLSHIKRGLGVIRYFLEQVVSKVLNWLTLWNGAHQENLLTSQFWRGHNIIPLPAAETKCMIDSYWKGFH